MRRYQKHIFVSIWLFALLSATFGVSVEQVYCYCSGKTRMAWFANDANCHKMSRPAAAGNCCSAKKAAAKGCHKSDGKQGCTKRTTYVFQLKTEYEVSHPEFKKLDAPALEYAVPVIPGIVFSLPQTEKKIYTSNDLPPPLSGRAICVRHGVFRC